MNNFAGLFRATVTPWVEHSQDPRSILCPASRVTLVITYLSSLFLRILNSTNLYTQSLLQSTLYALIITRVLATISIGMVLRGRIELPSSDYKSPVLTIKLPEDIKFIGRGARIWTSIAHMSTVLETAVLPLDDSPIEHRRQLELFTSNQCSHI